jgi:ATP-dependent Clp protease ATP-binding subunit ClpX
MFKRKLACSFCKRSEDEVAKLVAGPRVYICDKCAAEAVRIMNESDAVQMRTTFAVPNSPKSARTLSPR